MRFASFRVNGQDSYGVALADDEIVDIKASAEDCPDELIDLLKMGDAGRELAAKILDDPPKAAMISTDDITWHPPIRRPGKICGIAMNNSASNERKISAPEHPAFFLKPASCLIGHKQAVAIRSYYGSVHPEPELAVVIGSKTRDVNASEATQHIFGYTIFDDITGNGMRSEDLFQYYALYASDDDPDKLERREQHLSYAGRYKGTDSFGVMGPWLVSRDEIPDPDNLGVTCKVGGEIVAEDSTRFYNYKVAEIVSFISQFQTLHPGDVISCGTAFKPSADRKSIHHANLQKVDGPIEITIEGLGTQENPVIRKQMDIGDWRLS
ncbi:MAG: fumarylacetoacetate hydrolase family protein [Proteobacteria bacterium]|nr:fumarylacetoacetate hydrolase family protein [Pseudomonadota bacterium]